ncbi:hypothetical protein [Echinicola sp. 20G]|uniref:hypothetical protein n=1 Tax=Echinicola sp. 20G TaxID=2781961 RepID=UPI00190FE920|nr:hypothetical protein [Echinicola sp. 20G]
MKLNILNLVKGGVFLFAILAAFAFTQPVDMDEPRFGQSGSEWYDVTNVEIGPGDDQYQCTGTTSQCLYEDASTANPVAGALGNFEPGDDLDPIP